MIQLLFIEDSSKINKIRIGAEVRLLLFFCSRLQMNRKKYVFYVQIMRGFSLKVKKFKFRMRMREVKKI